MLAGKWAAVRKSHRRRGLLYTVTLGIPILVVRQTWRWAYWACCRLFRSGRTFTFQGRSYPYFYHLYNFACGNERTVEVPIARAAIREAGGRVLEVGNVLSHYGAAGHDVLDKYEDGAGVVREDIVDFRPASSYDLVVCVSTLEHVGWDGGEGEEPEKVLRAVEAVRGFLAPGGRAVVTLPVGYNPTLDGYLREGRLKFDRMGCLKRVSRGNSWVEASWEDVQGMEFGRPYPYANGLVIGVIQR